MKRLLILAVMASNAMAADKVQEFKDSQTNQMAKWAAQGAAARANAYAAMTPEQRKAFDAEEAAKAKAADVAARKAESIRRRVELAKRRPKGTR